VGVEAGSFEFEEHAARKRSALILRIFLITKLIYLTALTNCAKKNHGANNRIAVTVLLLFSESYCV
jgi:hypothetical protein